MPLDVKICGLTNYDDAMVALEAGADFLGFVLYPKSPRYVRPLELVRLLDRLPETAQTVAVCVNVSRPELDGLLRDAPLSRVQLHGDEVSSDYCDLPLPRWRAVSLRDGVLAPEPGTWPDCERFVMDAAAPGRYGGTGEPTDWDRAAREAQHLPLMLAGGLTPHNVAEAIHHVRPLGVDTSSGVERVPGQKDWNAVKQFVKMARQALAQNSDMEQPR